MGGDDDVARYGGKTAKGALAAWSERHRGVSWNLWSDRLSLKSACGLRVSRPLRAVRRRPLEVDISGWPSAGAASGHRRTAHRGLGLGQMPRAWNVGGFFLFGWEERGCQYGTGVNGGWSAAARHRRLGIASGGFGLTAERKRADTVGAAGGVGDSESIAVKDSLWPQVQTYAPDTVTQERCRGTADGKPEVVISRPEGRSGF